MSFPFRPFFAIASALLLSPLSLKAQTTLIDETFDAETMPEKWQPGGRKNSFSIVDGMLRGVARPDDSHGPAIGVPITGHDLTVEFDVKFVNPKGYFLFLIDGDSQFKGQAHLLRLGLAGKRCQLAQDRGDPASKLAQKKEKDANGGKPIKPTKEQLADPTFYRIEPLGNQEVTLADGKIHHVKIELKGNSVTAQFDDNAPLSGTGTVLDVPKTRIVFLVGQSGDMRIDNVKAINAAK